jgi:hypothetical protein
MTNDQANQFVSEVLRGLWQRWEPQDEEIRGWVVRLIRFDYGRAQKAVNDLFFSTPNRVNPPPQKVMAALKNKALIPVSKEESGPVIIFSIIKERYLNEGRSRFLYERRYCVSNRRDVPAREEIERRAGIIQGKHNELYGENHVVILHNLEGKENE